MAHDQTRDLTNTRSIDYNLRTNWTDPRHRLYRVLLIISIVIVSLPTRSERVNSDGCLLQCSSGNLRTRLAAAFRLDTIHGTYRSDSTSTSWLLLLNLGLWLRSTYDTTAKPSLSDGLRYFTSTWSWLVPRDANTEKCVLLTCRVCTMHLGNKCISLDSHLFIINPMTTWVLA